IEEYGGEAITFGGLVWTEAIGVLHWFGQNHISFV
ncbi:unnamed protein product, partial [Arabidopsis halleri]